MKAQTSLPSAFALTSKTTNIKGKDGTVFDSRNMPIHRGLISSYTTGLAAFGEINRLDKFSVGNGYYVQFRLFRSRGIPQYTTAMTAVDSVDSMVAPTDGRTNGKQDTT